MEGVDLNVGRVLAKLAELKLDENTMVIFTSDNGGTPQYVAPLNGSKGALYEGGIRVPAAVWWKGIKNPGTSSAEPILSMDFYTTIAELAGAELPKSQAIDGVSLMPLLRGETSLKREAVFWHFPCYIGRGVPSSAVRMGDGKLIEKFEDESLELYTLRNDPGESQNLAESQPGKAKELFNVLTRWRRTTEAPRPTKKEPRVRSGFGTEAGRQTRQRPAAAEHDVSLCDKETTERKPGRFQCPRILVSNDEPAVECRKVPVSIAVNRCVWFNPKLLHAVQLLGSATLDLNGCMTQAESRACLRRSGLLPRYQFDMNGVRNLVKWRSQVDHKRNSCERGIDRNPCEKSSYPKSLRRACHESDSSGRSTVDPIYWILRSQLRSCSGETDRHRFAAPGISLDAKNGFNLVGSRTTAASHFEPVIQIGC